MFGVMNSKLDLVDMEAGAIEEVELMINGKKERLSEKLIKD